LSRENQRGWPEGGTWNQWWRSSGQNTTTTTTHFHLTERWRITMLSLQSSYLVSYTWLVRLIFTTLRFVES
jgi:hypothetical protein